MDNAAQLLNNCYRIEAKIKWVPFCRRYFQINLMYFDAILLQFDPKNLINHYWFGLWLRRQAFIWANDDLIYEA